MIELQDVVFRWRKGDAPVLDVPSLDVATGEKVFIKGPSGSGKTTLLNLLGGVITPERGRVKIAGAELTALSGAARDTLRANAIGVIFQMFNLIPYLSVIENVLLPCRFSDKRKQAALARSDNLEQEAVRLLQHMEIDTEAIGERAASSLSVGQQQRVAVARSLIGSPELIIADEPTSALDADTRRSFMELLFHEIDLVGATLVFVSHDMQLSEGFDRTLSLHELNRGTRA